MGKYLDIADRALLDMAASKNGPARPMKPSRLYGEKSEICGISPDNKLLSLLGDDWPEVSRDPIQLEAFLQAASTIEQLRAGVVPVHYTSRTTCRRCGDVPIFDDCPPEVLGCPWCFAGSRPA